MKYAHVVLTLGLFLPAGTLFAQEASSLAGTHLPRPAELAAIDQRLGARFPESVALRIHRIIDSAAAEGLPRDPLLMRALEGGAKGVKADLIYAALERLRISMRRAAAALGPETKGTDLTTAAAALQTGLAPAKILELRTLRGSASLTVPLGSYLDLTARGAVPERAWARVIELARRDAADREYEKIDPAELVARQPEDPR